MVSELFVEGGREGWMDGGDLRGQVVRAWRRRGRRSRVCRPLVWLRLRLLVVVVVVVLLLLLLMLLLL